MTKRDIQQVQKALACAVEKVVGVEVSPGSPAAVFALPFLDRNGEAFRLYAYTVPKSRKIYLTDAGLIFGTLKRSGLGVQQNVLRQLLQTFQVTVLEDGSAVEQTGRPLWQRVASVIQALMTADGVLRTWTLHKEA